MNPKRFQVFQDNKPADCDSFPAVGSDWNKSVYDTFEEARAYAWQWIAPYGGTYDGSSGVDLKVNKPYEFAEGCFIEVREVE